MVWTLPKAKTLGPDFAEAFLPQSFSSFLIWRGFGYGYNEVPLFCYLFCHALFSKIITSYYQCEGTCWIIVNSRAPGLPVVVFWVLYLGTDPAPAQLRPTVSAALIIVIILASAPILGLVAASMDTGKWMIGSMTVRGHTDRDDSGSTDEYCASAICDSSYGGCNWGQTNRPTGRLKSQNSKVQKLVAGGGGPLKHKITRVL